MPSIDYKTRVQRMAAHSLNNAIFVGSFFRIRLAGFSGASENTLPNAGLSPALSISTGENCRTVALNSTYHCWGNAQRRSEQRPQPKNQSFTVQAILHRFRQIAVGARP